jgi:Flp pilus assembly protein TadD
VATPEQQDPSDLFTVRPPRDSKEIPRITAIPLTREEIRRRRVVRATVAAIVVLSALLALAVGLYLHERSQIEGARIASEERGRPEDLARALELLEGHDRPGDVALAARLHAAAELEGITGHRAAAEALLAGRDPQSDGASDHAIALTYLALAASQPAQAATYASGLAARGPRAAEAGRARALAALAIGNVPQALVAARAAAQEMPTSARHAALVALIAARAGETAPSEGDSIAMRIARARIQWSAGDRRSSVGTDLAPLVDDAAATPAERAWAQLLVGLSAIDAGNTEPAATAIAAAAQLAPPGDELFRIQLAEGWLALNRRSDAQAILDALAPGVSADAGRRAQALAELHLGGGMIAEAEAALANAPPGSRTSLLRARIADARDQIDTARPLYEEAARAPSEHLLATIALASMLSRANRAAEAIALVDPLLGEHATHPRVAAIAASSHAAAGDRVRGLAIVDAALREHAREPILLAAKARIHLAASEWQPALEALRVATEIEARDATLQTERGRAAKALGQLPEARTAFEAALALEPNHPEAMRSLLAVQIETRDLAAAEQTIARIDTAGLADLQVEQLRARYFVETLAGNAGIPAIHRARRNARRDDSLAYSLGRLHMQAEHWYDAIEVFLEAMPEEGVAERRDVALWRLLGFGRTGRRSTVEQLVEGLRETAATAPLTREQESRILMAESWVDWHEEHFPHAVMLARRAIEADPRSSEALLVLGMYDELQRRDPSARYRAAMEGSPPSVEAQGRLALLGETMDAERCALGRAFLRAAPEGAIAPQVRERVRTCPPQ